MESKAFSRFHDKEMFLSFRTLRQGHNDEKGNPIFSAGETLHVTDTSQRGRWIASGPNNIFRMIPHMASR